MVQDREQPKWRSLVQQAWFKVEIDDAAKPCILTNVSQKGAVVIIDDATDLPPKFWLWLTPDGAVKRACDVTRRSKQFIEIDFVDAHPASSKKTFEVVDDDKKSVLPQRSESSYAFSSRMPRLRIGRRGR
jgi:hypothetical protein